MFMNSSQSTKTGSAPAWRTALAVAMKVSVGTIDPVARAHAGGQQSHVQAGRAVDHGHGVRRPEQRAELLLEALDVGAGRRHPAAVEAVA